uniref:Uncharacterized protein n=1 Tax=Chlorocebus sabaeus TaxID=60711 RepID=A0A0D9SA18_CHLSB
NTHIYSHSTQTLHSTHTCLPVHRHIQRHTDKHHSRKIFPRTHGHPTPRITRLSQRHICT